MSDRSRDRAAKAIKSELGNFEPLGNFSAKKLKKKSKKNTRKNTNYIHNYPIYLKPKKEKKKKKITKAL